VSWQIEAALGLAVCVAGVFILQSWRRGVYFIFAWLLVEDVVRRLIPGQPVEIQAVKEALIFATYVAFFVTWRNQGRSFWSPPFGLSLFAFSAIVLLDAFNPGLQSLFIPAAGIRSYLWYVPLLWVGYHAFSGKTQLMRFSRRLLWTAPPLAALGVIQYVLWDRLPLWLQPLEGAHATHSAAWEYQGELIAFESKLPSSVFGSAHRFAMFSLFLFLLGLGVRGWRVPDSKRRRRLSRGLMIAASLVCIVVAGTRMGIALALVGLLLVGLEPVLASQKNFLRKRARVRQLLLGLTVGAVLWGTLQVFSDTGQFFIHSTEGDLEGHWEQFAQGQLPNVLKKAAWVGFGTGALSQGLAYIPGGAGSFELASRESEGVGIEYGLAKVTWELGVLGLAVFILLWVRVFWSLWNHFRVIRDPDVRGLAGALGIFALLVFVAFLKGHYYLGDGTTLVVFWFGLGMAFSLPRLDRIETARRSGAQAPAAPRALAVSRALALP